MQIVADILIGQHLLMSVTMSYYDPYSPCINISVAT